ncbi:SDR family oxidoreductase [Granulicella sibirica]|uniref:Oxidoreductase, short-chain dehydrogenase/reductase family n=1 Tax=Granulicella sibirica TaxID=2479048 RepID=A0A4Q0T5G2_9BACT|nr:SDR family oxidoreductase [Granulicella sibirica]RXH56811.1 Oxidoreductase, short-chain dehydrogenase/reductase family [Granulicella sibirica]
MQITGNMILITGGGSGIGRGLAEAFHKLGNQVIIAGRRKQVLDETTAANPGMKSAILNIEDAKSIREFAAQMAADYPSLNVLINNAGIMKMEKLLSQQENLEDAEATITTNLLGPIRLTAALLPLFQKQPHATIMTVSSGLAFLPLAMTPTYCATKAAIHSYTLSLRYQLQKSNIEVLELAPPYVATGLTDQSANDPRAMPLADFLSEVMEIIKTQPTPNEILVERVKQLRFAEKSGHFDAAFKGLNEAMAGDH